MARGSLQALLHHVPPARIESRPRLASLFASALAAQALSLQSAVLAEGGVRTMSGTHLKLTAVVLLILGIAGSGVGLLGRGTGQERPGTVPQDVPPPEKDGKKNPPASDKKGPSVPEREDPARALRKQLARRINFAGVEEKKGEVITLQQVLDLLTKQYGVQFEVNVAAFPPTTLDDVTPDVVLKTPIAARPTLRPRDNVTLASILREVLSQVPVEGVSSPTAVYLIRHEFIEITTTDAVRDELGIGADHALRLVWEDFDNVPFQSALRTLADASGMSIILDRRAVDMELVKAPVSARFANVQADTAVRILANMLDLRVVKVENVLYVTTEKRAASLLTELRATELRAVEEKMAKQGIPPGAIPGGGFGFGGGDVAGGLGALGGFPGGGPGPGGFGGGGVGGGLGALGGGFGALGGGLGALGGGMGALGGGLGQEKSPPRGGALGIPAGPSGGK
jgi:hypothetical protein